MEMFNVNLLEICFLILVVVLVLFVVIKIFIFPISIANRKNLTKNEISTIRILTWCGLFAGITWFIALGLAIFYKEHNNNY